MFPPPKQKHLYSLFHPSSAHFIRFKTFQNQSPFPQTFIYVYKRIDAFVNTLFAFTIAILPRTPQMGITKKRMNKETKNLVRLCGYVVRDHTRDIPASQPRRYAT
jgi:hypothetical protein